jgi:RUN domain-containing protein 1
VSENFHEKLRRNSISIFCSSRKLVQWLNSIFQCHELVTTFYTSWSYVAQTGFRDALKAIDQLSRFEYFDLPVDLAIRNLANIKDVFS